MNIIKNNLFIPSNFCLELKWFPGNTKANGVFGTFLGPEIQNQMDSRDHLLVGHFYQNSKYRNHSFSFTWILFFLHELFQSHYLSPGALGKNNDLSLGHSVAM